MGAPPENYHKECSRNTAFANYLFIGLNQILSYALIGALGLVSLLASLHAVHPFVLDVRRRIESKCAYSVLGTTSNLINSVVGGGNVEGIVFTPLEVKLSSNGKVLLACCGDSKVELEFPFEISPINTSVKGLVRIRAEWVEEGVSLVVRG